jgi:hypothetical protein
MPKRLKRMDSHPPHQPGTVQRPLEAECWAPSSSKSPKARHEARSAGDHKVVRSPAAHCPHSPQIRISLLLDFWKIVWSLATLVFLCFDSPNFGGLVQKITLEPESQALKYLLVRSIFVPQ